MSTPEPCPQCGAALPANTPAGLCPACLMSAAAAALDRDSDPDATMAHESTGASGAARGMPRPGETFGGYRIERELGRGGMGAVFAAEQLDTGRRVALKVLSHQLNSPEARGRFLREGRLAASINHPNSVYVFGTEEIEGTPVIAMELIAGGTLQERVQREGPLPVGAAVDALLHIIAGLEAAQSIGILHRDVKPANCFEDRDGTVKVGDFGLSISTAARGDSHLTLPGDFLGTPAFCSPEQLRGEELNVRSDIYAVGVTLYYLLTGQTPFSGKNMVALLATVLEKPAPSPRLHRPAIPESLAQVILRCLAKSAGDRYGSYDELRRAMLPFASTAPTPATIGLRILAYVVDHTVLTVINIATPLIVLWDLTYLGNPMQTHPVQWMWITGALLVFKFAYFGVLEGKWGATLGKAAVGLRVARLDRSAPGIPRALARFLLLCWPGLIGLFFADKFMVGQGLSEAETMYWAFGMLGITIFYMLVLFSTVRRRNGYATVHDLLTKTRVIQKAAYQPRAKAAAAAEPVTTTEAMPIVGPYQVLATLSQANGQALQLGYDTRLLRKVWIRESDAGEPPVSAPLRHVARPTRLRWLQGHRDEAGSWDAYEATEGRALPTLLGSPQPWKEARHWLRDLAAELEAAARDGSLPDYLSMDRVWITNEGKAKLLDFPAPGAGEATPEPTPAAEPAIFLNQVALSALEGRVATVEEARTRKVAAPVPLEARKTLHELPQSPAPAGLAERFAELLRQRPEVSRRRRCALMLGSLFPILFFGVLLAVSLVGTNLILLNNPLLQELRTLTIVYRAIESDHHFATLERKVTPEEKAALDVYIAHRYGPLVRDLKVWNSSVTRGMFGPNDRAVAEKLVAANPQVTEAECAAAAKTLEAFLKAEVTDWTEHRKDFQKIMPFIVIILITLVAAGTALWALLFAGLFRGGPCFHLLGIAVVNEDGSRSSRWRVLWRAIIAWAPILLIPLLAALILPLPVAKGAAPDGNVKLAAIVALGLLVASLWLCLAAMKDRGRGLHDRLAKTWLVPK